MIIPAITDINDSVSMQAKIKKTSLLTRHERRKYLHYKRKIDFSKDKPIQSGLKRFIDISHSIVGLVLTAPVMLASSVAIKLDSKGPVFFKQQRIGKDGKPFDIYKLRTMRTDTDDRVLLRADDDRVTRVGRFLRKFSFDELPQLINILKGDMSLVGPRPIIRKAHSARCNDPDFLMRYTVKPGATLQYPAVKVDDIPNARIDAEKEYISNWGLMTDLKTFAGTVMKVVRGSNY